MAGFGVPCRVRYVVLALLAACGGKTADAPSARDTPVAPAARDAAVAVVVADGPTLPEHRTFPDLASALRAVIPADARVIGFGELHSRVDRPNVRSSLAAFTDVLPSLGDQVSDLVVETWVVDPKCGATAVNATKKVETAVKRPEATKSEIAQLAEAARAAKIQPHAMTLACKDYKTIAPDKGAPDPIAMLTLTTRELTRIATSAIAYRDKQRALQGSESATVRPWIFVYGGALHNDRFPAPGVSEWSYAAAIDKASADRYVEIDLLVPELAEPDEQSQKQPWFPLVAAAKQVTVWTRGDRSFVVLLPRTTK
jgi:hypothetical protein